MTNKRINSRNNQKRSVTSGDVRRIITSMAEVKRYAQLSTANVPAAAGAVQNLTNGIIQGDDLTQRSGDKLRIVKHILRVRFTAVVASQTVRFIFFKDNTNRGTTPAVTEVLNSASVMSQYNPINMLQHRFTILGDVSLNCSLQGEIIKERTFTQKGGYPVFYNGTTAVAASNGPGSTYVLVIGDTASGLYDFAYEAHYLDL